MKEMGAPVRARKASFSSKAFQVFTTNMGIQHMKNMATMTMSMRITRFLAMSLASELLIRVQSILVQPLGVRVDISMVLRRLETCI
ncbi:hypothetical protein FKM82_001580 [Ascaphus truei]